MLMDFATVTPEDHATPLGQGGMFTVCPVVAEVIAVCTSEVLQEAAVTCAESCRPEPRAKRYTAATMTRRFWLSILAFTAFSVVIVLFYWASQGNLF
jgi:predicted nucleic acid-binding Zn ribbon protein